MDTLDEQGFVVARTEHHASILWLETERPVTLPLGVPASAVVLRQVIFADWQDFREVKKLETEVAMKRTKQLRMAIAISVAVGILIAVDLFLILQKDGWSPTVSIPVDLVFTLAFVWTGYWLMSGRWVPWFKIRRHRKEWKELLIPR